MMQVCILQLIKVDTLKIHKLFCSPHINTNCIILNRFYILREPFVSITVSIDKRLLYWLPALEYSLTREK